MVYWMSVETLLTFWCSVGDTDCYDVAEMTFCDPNTQTGCFLICHQVEVTRYGGWWQECKSLWLLPPMSNTTPPVQPFEVPPAKYYINNSSDYHYLVQKWAVRVRMCRHFSLSYDGSDVDVLLCTRVGMAKRVYSWVATITGSNTAKSVQADEDTL